MYGAGKFGYSINDVDTAALTKAASAASGNYTTGSVAWTDVDFEPNLSASVSLGSEADNGLDKDCYMQSHLTQMQTLMV